MADSRPPELDQLRRENAGKTSVRIIDRLDLGHPLPQRMRERQL